MPLPVAVAPRVILVLAPRTLREAALRCSAFATERAFALETFFVLGIAFSVGGNSITVLPSRQYGCQILARETCLT
jgi:hypothetical protein